MEQYEKNYNLKKAKIDIIAISIMVVILSVICFFTRGSETYSLFFSLFIISFVSLLARIGTLIYYFSITPKDKGMRVKLLKRLRKEASKKIYVMYIPPPLELGVHYKYSVHYLTKKRNTFEHLESAKKYCDDMRREWILEQAKTKYKPTRVY